MATVMMAGQVVLIVAALQALTVMTVACGTSLALVTTFTSPTKNVMVLKMITEERHLTNVKLNVLKTTIVDLLIGQHMEVQVDVMQEPPTVDVTQ